MKVQLIVFRIADQVYGFENKGVCAIRFVPGDSILLSGILYSDKAIPVIDLRQRLGFPLRKPGILDRIIILELEGELVGIKVDEVLEVSYLEVEELETGNGSKDCGVISGVGHWGKEPVLVLDCKRLFLEEIKCITCAPDPSVY